MIKPGPLSNIFYMTRRNIEFPLGMLADQIIYFLQINHTPVYRAFNRLPGPRRRQLLNDVTREMVEGTIAKFADVGVVPEAEEEWPEPPMI